MFHKRPLALAFLLIAACSDSGERSMSTGPPFHHRLTLMPEEAGDGMKPQGPVLVKRYTAPEGLKNSSWKIEDEFDPKAFNQVVVSLTNRRQARAKVVFERDGERVFGTPSIQLARSPHPQLVIFSLPSLRRREIRITQMEVSVGGVNEDYALHSADLVLLPLHATLPSGDGELVSAEDQARRVVGLTSDRPLEGVAPLSRGAQLTFSVLQQDAHRYPGQSPLFTVVARDMDGEVVEESVPLDGRISGAELWAPIHLDLSPLSGDQVWVRVKLEVRGEEPGACVLEAPYLSVPNQSARTVLLITSDTHRADALGVEDSDLAVLTPHLDALAERGVRFTDCYSSTNVTSPSHVSLMTGTSPRDTGIITNTGHMAEAALTLAERFREHGYVTYAVASVRHLGPLGTGLGQGFDRIAAPRGDVWDAELSLDMIESWLPSAEGRPLFAWLHLFDAHAPYGPPGEFDRRYYPGDKDPFDSDTPVVDDIDPKWLNGAIRGLKDPEFALAQYRGEVDYLDQQLGRLLERPRFRDGVVAFTSDHGESFGSGEVWFSHVGLFPATLHVPMILSWPGGPTGEVVSYPVEHIHLGRTLLDLAGFQGDDFPGRSLLAAIGSSEPATPRFSLSANGKCASVTQDGWQLTLNLRTHEYHDLVKRSHHQVELFHVTLDPECEVDLWEEELERSTAMRRLMMAWLADTRGSSWARAGSEDADALAQLAALGYTMDVPDTEERSWFDLDCACGWCARF